MATLEARLEAIRKDFASRAPEHVKAVMARATQDLADSGLAERALREGANLPEFTLTDQHGVTHSSSELLAAGPLVLTVFRGHW